MKRPTQAEVVMDHLKRADYSTDSQATSLYGIGQLAYVVHKLRKKGIKITSTMKPCIKPGAVRYAEYRLA